MTNHEVCGDNRFELIEKYKNKLLDGTNIDQSKDEMAVIDGILFRFWQMRWLDKLEQFDRQKAEIERLSEELRKVRFDYVPIDALMDGKEEKEDD